MAIVDVIVIGAGHNGLVAAALLARKGASVLVLERQPVVGGMAITREFAPGFKAPALAHSIGPLRRDVQRALKRLKFDKAAPQLITPDPALTTLGHNGQIITFHRDPVFTAESINRIAPKDAGRWREFLDTMQRLSGIFADLNRHAPPPIDDVSRGDLWRLAGTGRRAKSLGRKNLARLVRYVPMAVADLVSEWFAGDLLQAAVASRAVYGHFAGPWSAGTGALLLQRLADDPLPVGSGITVAGGPGALSDALAAVAEKVGVRVRTGAGVARIQTKNGRATGVVLENGEEIAARFVLAAGDPKSTFLKLIDPADLPPTFLQRVRNIRARGVTAKINLALSARPVFDLLKGEETLMRGRLLVAPGIDYLEKAFDAAKYGEISAEPWLDVSVPTVVDGSLAPDGQHVMSIVAHVAPRHLRDADWSAARETLLQRVLAVLQPHAPGLGALIVGTEIITPEDLELQWGVTGGHIFHGEQTVDQWWAMRPTLGWAQNATPIDRLFITGAGTHGGGGVTGGPGFLAAEAVASALKARRRE
jgi:phytoene dehydrogenase-like protein